METRWWGTARPFPPPPRGSIARHPLFGRVPTNTPVVSAAKRPAKSASSPCGVEMTPPRTVDLLGTGIGVPTAGVGMGGKGVVAKLALMNYRQDQVVDGRVDAGTVVGRGGEIGDRDRDDLADRDGPGGLVVGVEAGVARGVRAALLEGPVAAVGLDGGGHDGVDRCR